MVQYLHTVPNVAAQSVHTVLNSFARRRARQVSAELLHFFRGQKRSGLLIAQGRGSPQAVSDADLIIGLVPSAGAVQN